MDERKTFHVWMPDGRSLCDRRARLPRADFAAMTDEQFATYVDEQTAAPACGSCLVIVDRLRLQAATILEYSDSVYPSTPVEAWLHMQGTRWDATLNLARFRPGPDTEAPAFERLLAKLPAARLRRGVEQFAAERTQVRQSFTAARKKLQESNAQKREGRPASSGATGGSNPQTQ